MSIEQMDNPSQYGVGQQGRLTNGVYAEASNCTIIADPSPTSTGDVFSLNGRPAVLRYVLSGNQTKVGMACRMWLPALPTDPNQVPTPFSFRDGSNNAFLNIRVSTTGALLFNSAFDGSGAQVGATTGPVVTANAWWHIEVWATFNAVSGCAIEVRVEGVPVFVQTLATITNPNCAQVAYAVNRLSNFVSDITMNVKDVVIMNGNGSHNTTFIGAVSVYNLLPASDVSLNWTPSTGAAGWSILDNIPADDTKFISAGTPPPSPYVGTLADLPLNVTSIKGIMTQVRGQKIDGGDGNLQVGVVTGSATALGSNRPITAAMTYWRDVFEVDPNTSSPYTVSAVNASNIQLNRTV